MPRSRSLAFLSALLVLLIGAAPTQGQDRGNTVPRVSPNATVGQTIGVTEVTIRYGRPSVRGRDIFGGLVPFGEVWRTGANEATTISFSTPVHIEGQALDAGTYGFFTIPGPDQWTLIFNETAEQWGAYNYDAGQDALRVQVTPQSASAQELLTFSFHNVTDTSATAALRWAETRVPFEIAANTTEILRTRADSMMADASDWRAPLPYVGYALENEVLLDDAVAWINRSVELNERFGNLRLKAYVLAANGQYEQAVETANAALRKADERDEAPNGLEELRNRLDDWKAEL